MRRGVVLVVLLAVGAWEPLRSKDAEVDAGNRAYAHGEWGDAIGAYDRAAHDGVDAGGLAFDRGTAELERAAGEQDGARATALREEAIADLRHAHAAIDPLVRAAASYNLGNLLMQQDAPDALADAIAAYKQALREDPAFDDARANLEIAMRRKAKQEASADGGNGSGSGSGQGPSGQGQGPSGQGQGQQGQGQQGQGQPGQGQGQPGQGQGQRQNGQGQSGQGQAQPGGGSNGSGGGHGSGDPTPTAPGAGSGSPRHRPGGGGAGHGSGGDDDARSGTDRKLDDLETMSRRLERDHQRRSATGHTAQPDRDW